MKEVRLYHTPTGSEPSCITGGNQRSFKLGSACNTPRKLVWRAGIILATADGHDTFEIMRRAKTSKPTVWRWQKRYLEEGVAGLDTARACAAAARVSAAEGHRQDGAGDTAQRHILEPRVMAEAMGISPSGVDRIWAEAGLKPYFTKGFKVSNDPKFEETVTNIVGLHLDPPDRAASALCHAGGMLQHDEKFQIQALDLYAQPKLPLKKGRAATATHDYKRHGQPRCSLRWT